ncbi:MAG TPA: FkbM family methyltransferase [Hanamia sp.]|nr:FkbM family methyltransferase [Hanamia sp.]
MPSGKFLHAFFRLFGIKLERTISSLGNKLAVHGIKKEEYVIEGEYINFKSLNLRIPVSDSTPILEGYENAIELSKMEGASFFVDAQNELNFQINGLQFKINDKEELFILTEVFVEGSYNLIVPTQKKIALIDVGMNVGITTLFYASKPNVEKVFSFEPFVPTFNMALNNFQLNELYAAKVEKNNFGLAKEDSNMTVTYSTQDKGRMGINGFPKDSDRIAEDLNEQQIILKSASTQFQRLKESLNNHFVVCKIDCEGAEYEIIDSLDDGDQLSLPDVYFIEWHYKSPANIVSKLTENKYTVINTRFRSLNLGMVYAIKNKS